MVRTKVVSKKGGIHSLLEGIDREAGPSKLKIISRSYKGSITVSAVRGLSLLEEVTATPLSKENVVRRLRGKYASV